MRFKDIIYALRHILRYKEYSLLNVAGLALGMASALLVLLWIQHEVQTDRFHANGDDIYIMRKMTTYSNGATEIDGAMTAPFAEVIEKEIPEVRKAVRYTWEERLLFRLGDKMFYEKGHYADSGFFTMFSFPLLQGEPAKVLRDPNSVVISETLAEKYFGKENAVGRIITIRDNKEEMYTVTGIFKKIPGYSSMKFDFILPYSKYYEYNKSWIQWGNFHLMTFLLAQPGTTAEVLDQKINEVYERHGTWKLPKFFVQSFEKAYLYGDYADNKEKPSGLILYIRIFSMVAIFIIFLACMNYTNLATALSTRRGREVGIKKVFGSGQKYIFRQFTVEAFSLTIFAFLLSILLIELALPLFNKLINTELVFDLRNPRILFTAVGVPVLTGILAGVFPAFYMSSFKPVQVLKSSANPNKGVPVLRQSLVIVQFVITIAFIISSLLIFKQIKYIQNKTLGLNEENILFFPQSLYVMNHRNTFKEILREQPGVSSVTYTNDSPLGIGSNTSDPSWKGKQSDYSLSVPYIQVDADFCKTFNVDIIAGRDFREGSAADTNSILINEKFAGIIGLDDPVGEIISYWGRQATVIGVVKDFHIGGMHRPIQQLMIINRPGNTYLAMVKIDGNMRKQAIRNIEKAFREFDETIPFEYEFVDVEYARNYESVKYLSRLALVITILSIVISCLGLFGLALFTAEQRTKEIGIRKSNGARTSQVMIMLTRKFLSWVVVSFILASLIAYLAMQRWLESFAFHTELSWWVFIMTGLIAMLLALVTVSWQAYRAANRNPVESLRYE